MKIKDGIFLKNFENIYLNKNNGMNISDIQKMNKNSFELLCKACDNNGEPNCKTGLLLGKIQSGKTSNYLNFISTSFAYDAYDIVIIFAGKDETLFKQNSDRIYDTFADMDSNSFFNPVEIYESANGFDKETISEIKRKIDKKIKIIILALKHQNHFNQLNLVLKNNNILNKKILFIDDEGDQGSLNNNATKIRKQEYLNICEDDKITATRWNKDINNLRSGLTKHSYITVTATPYANIFIPKEDELIPKFIQTTKPGNGYTGLDIFHDNSKNIIEISQEDMEDVKEIDPGYLKNKSLNEAISTFVIGAALNFKNNKIKNSQMLVQYETRKKWHKTVSDRIKKIIRTYIHYSEQDDQLMLRSFDKFFLLGFNNYFKDQNYDDKHKLKQDFLVVLGSIKIKIINADNEREIETKIKNPTILIGASLLERGITLNNLITVYFTRSPKIANADTVQQRARWLGYRKNVDLIKLFLPKILISRFEEIRNLESELWRGIEGIDQGEFDDVQDWINNLHIKFDFELNKMMPTRKGIAPDMKISHKYKSWYDQKNVSTFVDDDEEQEIYSKLINDYNYESFDSIKHKVKDFSNKPELFSSDSWNLIRFLSKKLNISENYLREYIIENNLNVKFILTRPDNIDSYRNVSESSGRFFLLAGGKRTSDLESGYKGDANIEKYNSNSKKILILIYKLTLIKDGFKNKNQICYAVYFPNVGSTYITK